MQIELLNYVLAFLEGFALIISPCILPILPVILSGSIQGGKKRPFGIIIGFVVVFVLFTFFSRKLVAIFGIDLNIIRNISLALLFMFGIVMLSNYLTDKFDLLTQRLANVGSSLKIFNEPNSGFSSGILFGSLIGIIWTPCAGPILAAVILQTILQKTDLSSFITVLFFGIGVSIPMLIITIFGNTITTKFSFFKTHAISLRRLLGYIIIASVVYMIYGSGITISLTKPKENLLIPQKMLIHSLNKIYPMPQINGIAAWINSEPLQSAQLKNKVILIDFWTYSCINCIRTLPYLKDWYEKYHDQGLIIIGVHSPEFDFEKDLSNVKKAVANLGIKYPVALDNNYITWQNFNNHYWPAHYLIDKNGNVVYEHFGEGEYDVTENNIRFLLGLNSKPMQAEKTAYVPQTPETYLGYERADRFNSPEFFANNKSKLYSYPEKLNDDAWALKGNWIIEDQRIIADSPSSAIKLHFRAGKVYVVMGIAAKNPIKVKLFLNGNPAPIGEVEVTTHTLYTLLDLSSSIDGTLEIVATEPGLEMYAFTFGV